MVRVTVSHNRTRQEVIKEVDEAVNRLTTTRLPLPVSISSVDKAWNESTMNFSLMAAMGPFKSPIRGTVTVTDKDVTIECDLPNLLTALVPEKTIEGAVQTQVRGLLR